MVGAAEVQQCPSVHGSPLLWFCLCQQIHFEMKKQRNMVTAASSVTSVIGAGARAAVMFSSPSFRAASPWPVNAAGLTQAGSRLCLRAFLAPWVKFPYMVLMLDLWGFFVPLRNYFTS